MDGGMLEEKAGVFIAAAAFIAAQRRELWGAWLGPALPMTEREAVGGERQLWHILQVGG